MNDTVEIFRQVISTTSRGVVRKLWGDAKAGEIAHVQLPGDLLPEGEELSNATAIETIVADVQPRSLNAYELAAYGVNDIPTDSRVMYYKGASDNLVIGNRVRVNGAKWFEIRGVQNWPRHCECLLAPVVGVSNG